MKALAMAALNVLARDIHAGANLWKQTDRIERRFGLVGYTEWRVGRLEAQQRAWCKTWLKQNVHYSMAYAHS